MSPRSVNWICHACAIKSGARVIPNHVATYHIDTCGVCGEEVIVTEPRDYRWPVVNLDSDKS